MVKGAFLVSLVNIGNMVGRILMGALVDLPWISSIVVFNVTTITTGLTMLTFLLVTEYWVGRADFAVSMGNIQFYMLGLHCSQI